jgi:hypothetical protein
VARLISGFVYDLLRLGFSVLGVAISAVFLRFVADFATFCFGFAVFVGFGSLFGFGSGSGSANGLPCSFAQLRK